VKHAARLESRLRGQRQRPRAPRASYGGAAGTARPIERYGGLHIAYPPVSAEQLNHAYIIELRLHGMRRHRRRPFSEPSRQLGHSVAREPAQRSGGVGAETEIPQGYTFVP